MKLRFLLTPEAKSDLSEILLSVAEDKPEMAERLRIDIYKEFLNLSRSPGDRSLPPRVHGPPLRFWNFYSYVVCYVWETKPNQIVAIVHGARDLAAFFTARAH